MAKSKGNRLKFSKEEDERLINEISMHPALYDAKNNLYKDQNVRNNIWQEVSIAVKKSVEDCKKRWRSLKDVYLKKKKENKQGTGSSARQASKWEHMDALAFLETVETSRKTVSSINVTITDEGNMQGTSGEMDDLLQETQESLELQETQEMEETEEIQQDKQETQYRRNANLPESSETLQTNRQKKKRKTTSEKMLDTINKRAEERTKLFKKIESAVEVHETPHPVKLFFASMAETVISFPPALAARAKMKVLQVITELELENCGSIPPSRASSHSESYYSDTAAFTTPNSVEQPASEDCASLFSTFYQN